MYKHNQEKISDGQIGLKNHQEAFILPFSQIFIFKKIPKTCILFVYLKITPPSNPPTPTSSRTSVPATLTTVTSQLIPPFVLPESPPYFVFNQ
jgi:hypothetical protein